MRLLHHTQAFHANRKNQDFIETRQWGSALLLALADGQGGQAGGALAARVAAESALEFLENVSVLDEATLRLSISIADDAAEAHSEVGFTTLIVLYATETEVLGASAGDSQVWHLGAQGAAHLSEEQQKNPPVGSGAALGTPFRVSVKAGEQILMMSDGVFRFVAMDDIARVCRQESDENVLRHLLELQKKTDGEELPDDWSALLIRF